MNIAHLLPALLGLFWSLSAQAGGDTPAEPAVSAVPAPGVPWVKLEYAAKAAAAGVSMSLELARSSPSDLREVHDPGPGNSTPDYLTAEQVRLLSVTARAQSLFGGSRTALGIWFDTNSAAVLQRDKLRPGSKGNQKVYRFAEDGAFRVKREPSNRDEAGKEPANWSKVKKSFYPYDAEASGCQVVSEPTLLLYVVSRPRLGDGDATESVCVFLDDSLYRVRLEPQHSEPLDIGYKVNSGAAQRKVIGKQEVVKIALQVEPLTQGADSKDFELLELRGDIAIFVVRDSGLPIQLSGARSGIGPVDVRLEEATLAAGVNGGSD